MDPRIPRLRRKLAAIPFQPLRSHSFGEEQHKFFPGPKPAEARVAAFEAEHDIVLPDAYRRFLTHISGSGAAPFYGLMPLERCSLLVMKPPEEHVAARRRYPSTACPARRRAPRAGRPRPHRPPRRTAPGEGHGRQCRAAALEDARFDARQAFQHEDLADDVRGRAELAEWERLDQLLADAGPGAVYDPDADDVVQAERAADAAAAAAREAELHEAARIAASADELQALRELGTLEQTEPRAGDEAVRDELTRRAGGYVQSDIDTWLAHALAAHLGHYADPAAREAAAGLLPSPVLAHAALLAELARLVPGADIDQLAFAARLATTEPEAAGALAVFLARARS